MAREGEDGEVEEGDGEGGEECGVVDVEGEGLEGVFELGEGVVEQRKGGLSGGVGWRGEDAGAM